MKRATPATPVIGTDSISQTLRMRPRFTVKSATLWTMYLTLM
ncbi:hypothetical protein [Paenibacillus odorifer]|nr:hypothetical protein [Paenibacillus odorifer]